MRWFGRLLAASCVVLAAAAPTHAYAASGDVAPLLQRHVERILTTQADDTATCDAAFEANSFKSYLTSLPETAGIRNCVASNIQSLLVPLSAQGSKCTLSTLVTLLGSGNNTGLDAFSGLFSALVSGLTSSSSSSASTATSLTSTLSSWTSSSTKNEAFCSTMNAQIGPCVETLLPALVSVLDKKGACCSQLIEFYELGKLLVPDGKTLDQTLVDVVNGLHLTMCTTTNGANAYCGQSLLAFLSDVIEQTGDTSLLSPLLFNAGLPLFALPDGSAACSALESTSFASRVSASGGAYTYTDLSCCSPGFASLIQSFDVIVQHLTGNSLAETLNLIAALQNSTSQFAAPYDTLADCSFKTKCTNPSFTLTKSTSSPVVTANSTKNERPQELKCTASQLCNADKVCTNVCAQGTVQVAPWVSRAISYQRNLSYAQPLCYTQLAATHNSGTTLARGWGNRDQLMNEVLDANNSDSYMRTNNQFLTLTDQLDLGVRFIELDVHYFAKTIHDGHCSRISFAFLDDASLAIKTTTEALLSAGATTAVTVEWQSSLMGCLPSLGGLRAEDARVHADTVKEVAAWLTANPNDFLMVYLDVGSEMTTFKKYDEMLSLHSTAYGDLLLTPADMKTAGNAWKSTPLSDFVKAGKRVAIITSKDADGDVYFSMDNLCGGWKDIPSGKTGSGAGTIWGAETNTGSIVRVYASQLHYATMSEEALGGDAFTGTATEPAVVNSSTLSVFVNAGVNIVAPDGLDGAMMEAMIWSWAAKEPSQGDTVVEISAKDGRWYGVADKSSIKNVACVSSSSRVSWKIVAQGSSCPSGYAFGAPTLAIENAALATALQATGADATAQLNVDLTNFPVITAEQEAAYDGASPSGSTSGTSGTDNSSSSKQSSAVAWSCVSTAVVAAVVAALALVMN